MTDSAEDGSSIKLSESVQQLREDLRQDLQNARNVQRHSKNDSIRIGIGELGSYLANLETFSANEVVQIANQIKRRKHANANDLNRLSHAFLQNTENIQSFVNVTGALNVIVKELTGNDTSTQILAVECLCNLSLGPDVCSERVTLCAGSYLITFLKSSNNRLAQTSLWCLTNLAASGHKSLSVLVTQELLKSLLALDASILTEPVNNDIYTAIEVIVSCSMKDILRPDDRLLLIKWILTGRTAMDFKLTKIVYHFLAQAAFQLDNQHYEPFMAMSMKTLLEIHSKLDESSKEASDDIKEHLIIVLRLIGNIVTISPPMLNYFITNSFVHGNSSLSSFLNNLLSFSSNDEHCYKELLWFIGNIVNKSNNLNENCLKYLENDKFLDNLLIAKLE